MKKAPARGARKTGRIAAFLVVSVGLAVADAPPKKQALHENKRPLDVTEAIRLALKYNAEIARAALEVRRQALSVQAAEQTARGLRIRPVGFVRGSEEDAILETGIRAERSLPWGGDASAGISARQISLRDGSDFRDVRISVELTQPLFRRFGREVRDAPLEEADEQLRLERRRWTIMQGDLIVAVVRVYEEIQWLLRRIETDKAFLRRLEALQVLTEARESRGQAGRLDSLKVELQRGEAELRLQTGRDRLDVLRLELCEYLGVPLDTRFELAPAPILEVPDIEAEEAAAVAYGWRMEYAQVLDDVRQSRRRLNVARRALQPDLTVLARYERGDEGQHWNQAVSLTEDAWTLGLAWDMDAHRASARTAVQLAEVDVKVQLRRLELERVRIARDVHTRLIAHRRARAEERLAIRNRRLAENRAELARSLYQAGRGDAFTVSDAEDAFLQADLNGLALRRSVAVTAYEFLRALGTLVAPPDDLRPVEKEGGKQP